MKGCLCIEQRGKKICYFMVALSPWPHQCWLSHHFIALGAGEKAGRRLVNSATFAKRMVRTGQEVTDCHPSCPVTGAKGRRGTVVRPWNKAALPWTRCAQVLKVHQPAFDFSGLYYFSQEEATWKWHLPCNLGTSWKTIITYHIVITRHRSLLFEMLASLSSILKFFPRPEKQDKAL